MKTRTIKLFVTATLMLLITCPSPILLAQKLSTASPNRYMKHPQAISGSTAERKAAWDGLNSDQQKEVKLQLQNITENAKASASKQSSTEITAELSFVNVLGIQNTISATGKNTNSQNLFAPSGTAFNSHTDARIASRPIDPCPDCEPTPDPTPTPNPTPTPDPTPTPTGCGDADTDGLDDCFEANLADGFTPAYHVSAGENYGTGFSFFYNSVPQTVSQTFGSTPPISHYRVKPLRYEYGSDGILYGLVQIDYLTLWNRDDGLIAGSFCYALAPVLGFSLDGVGAHNLDNERSAMLVAAPLVNNSFNPDISAYNAYELFTAAHEDTPLLDQSLLLYYYQPLSYGQHIGLGLSKAKHSTYPFNPDYKPIIQNYVIYLTYVGIELRYYYSNQTYEDYVYYLAELFAADTFFYTCVVEHFDEQGGFYSGTRINVGEPSSPINNSGFIQSTELYNKLQKQF